ncbi:hypothetical protein ACIQ4I_04160 [Rummeliibacillus sp. NPDC094406]|uniref:hypothetical protein n=1 Tax=Rummeliibacillus sp. NPDC094406 TaxID=3364511 RepID=UPI003829FB21
MIDNKKMFYTAIIIFVAVLILNLPIPNEGPLGETVASDLNIPVRSTNGILYVGITSLTLLLAGLFFLNNSLNKYHVRATLIAIMVVNFAPSMIVSSYQKTFATGIYAVSYESGSSSCNFNMINKKTLHGECKLPFKNYSSTDIKFSIEFYDKYDGGVPMVTLMNNNGPYEVELKGNQRKTENIETNIDVSKIKNHIYGGNAMGVNIILKSGKKMRKL